MRLLPLNLASPFLACAEPGPTAPDPSAVGVLPELSGWHVAGEEDGLLVAWRPLAGEVRRNQDLDLAVRVYRDGVALLGAQLVLRGWMPDHGHGFVQAPRVTEEGGGTYRVDGVRLHMRGSWQLFFDVHSGSRTETVRFDLEV